MNGKTDKNCIDVTPGELNVGDCITIMNWVVNNPAKDLEAMGISIVGLPEPSPSQYLTGAVLEIKGISLPYLLVENLSDYETGHIYETVDTREFYYKLMTEEFVNAIKENKKACLQKAFEDKERAFQNSMRIVDIQKGQFKPASYYDPTNKLFDEGIEEKDDIVYHEIMKPDEVARYLSSFLSDEGENGENEGDAATEPV
jgi:hypothetical protein